MAITVGTKLRDELHLVRTGWLDIDGAGQKFSVFNPDEDAPAKRYGCPVRPGNPNVTAIRGYLDSNITGAHAAGLNSRAIEVVYRLWPDVTPSPHDLEDIDMVNGAATEIVRRAIVSGLLDDQGGDGTSSDPCFAVKGQLVVVQAAFAAATDEKSSLQAKLVIVKAASAKALKAMPGKGGGVYRNILVELLSTLEGL